MVKDHCFLAVTRMSSGLLNMPLVNSLWSITLFSAKIIAYFYVMSKKNTVFHGRACSGVDQGKNPIESALFPV